MGQRGRKEGSKRYSVKGWRQVYRQAAWRKEERILIGLREKMCEGREAARGMRSERERERKREKDLGCFLFFSSHVIHLTEWLTEIRWFKTTMRGTFESCKKRTSIILTFLLPPAMNFFLSLLLFPIPEMLRGDEATTVIFICQASEKDWKGVKRKGNKWSWERERYTPSRQSG